jgi:predicted permease
MERFERWCHDRARDVRYAGRTLLGSPGFTATVVLSLALGIGANTAIFSILHALVLRSLPVSDPERLVVVIRNQVSTPYPLFRHLRERSQTLDGVLAFRTAPMRLEVDGVTERVTGALVSGSYFDVLGVQPAAGTAIADGDDVSPGTGGSRGPVAMLSHGAWMRRFGGQSSVIGSRILLNGQPFTVIGIAARGFNGTEVGESPDVFAPMMMQPVLLPALGTALSQPRSNWIRITGRLKANVDVRQAEAELTSLLQAYNQDILKSPDVARFGPAYRQNVLNQRITLVAGNAGISQLRQQYSKPLWVLMMVMGVVLLIACANVASLLLSRAAARRREIAIRLGLGAARSRLISQLLTESVLLAAAGVLAGLLLARTLRDVLLTYLPSAESVAVPLDLEVLLFALAVAAGAALLFGLVPAFQSTKVDVISALKDQETSAGPVRIRLRKGLVVFQVSLSLLLLVAAALFLRSLDNLRGVETGFTRDNILIAAVDARTDRQMQFYPRLLEEMKQLPGVLAAALADTPPLGVHTGWNIVVPGYVPQANEPRSSPWVGFISPGYFATMRIPLLLGRDIDERDVSSTNKVMVVNETFARHFFAGGNPIGRRVGLAEGVYDYEIVGVVKDGKYTGLREESLRMVYVPFRPGPWASHMVVHLRTASDPSALATALREKVRALDATAPVFDVHTVRDEIDRSLLRERLLGTITTLFGGLALLLAAIGLYGTMSYGVARRTREFGIRVAIGAGTGSILRLVLREALGLVVAGVSLGLASAWALGRVVRSMLFAIEPTDLVSIAIAGVVLVAVALAASAIPARRASRVDPTMALRAQ